MLKTKCLLLVTCCVLLGGSALGNDDLEALIDQVNQGSIEAIDQLSGLGNRAKAAVPALTKALESTDAERRWHAARTLGAIGPAAKGSVPELTKAMSDKSGAVRAYAAYALGQMGKDAESAIDTLIKSALDRDVLVRRACVRALRQIDAPIEKTLPIVVKVLEGADASLVVPMLHTFAEQGKEALPRLRAALKHERACYWACLVLAEIGADGAEAVPELKEVLKHGDPDVRLQALLALGEIGPASQAAVSEIIRVLETDRFPNVQTAAAYALTKIDAEGDADDKALEKLLSGDDQFLGMLGAWGLAQMAPENKARVELAIKMIVSGLKSDDNYVQSAAARALAELEAPGELVAPPLVAALTDDDPTVVGNALDALAAVGPEALPELSKALANDQLKVYAVQVMYRMGAGAAPAVPGLVEALELHADDSEFQREAHFALAAMGAEGKAAVGALVRALKSDDIEVLGSAAYALGKIGPASEDAIPALLELLNGSDPQARRVAVWALLKIRPKNERLARRAVPLLIEALKSERVLSRIEASLALGELGEVASSAVPQLKKLLDDEVPAVRQAAAKALESLDK